MTSLPHVTTLADITTKLAVITHSRYRGTRNIKDLQTIYALAEALQIELVTVEDTNRRAVRLIAKQLDIHLRAIKARMELIERANMSKARKMQSDRQQARLVTELVSSGVLSQVIQQRKADAAEQSERAIAAPVMAREFKELGYDPTADAATRAKQIDAIKQGMPDTDLTKQGDETQGILERAYGTGEDWLK